MKDFGNNFASFLSLSFVLESLGEGMAPALEQDDCGT